MEKPEIDKSQFYYGTVVHWVTIVSCLLTLVTPFFILWFPDKNLLNPALIFGAIFSGENPAGIWAAAGVPFNYGDFWKFFITNFFSPDGIATFGLALGCSVTLWALIPALWQFLKKKEYYYVCVALFVMALIALAMSGLVNMAG